MLQKSCKYESNDKITLLNSRNTNKSSRYIFYNSEHNQGCFPNIHHKLIGVPTCSIQNVWSQNLQFTKAILHRGSLNTSLRIAGICINISKQAINPSSLEFMMAATRQNKQDCVFVQLKNQILFIIFKGDEWMEYKPMTSKSGMVAFNVQFKFTCWTKWQKISKIY